MDKSALYKLTSGLYVVSAQAGQEVGACVVNTGLQVTGTPLQVEVVVNKENHTTGVIGSAGSFALTVLGKDCDMPFIGRFGFKSSRDFDKFEGLATERTILGDPYATEHAVAVLACRVGKTVDLGTHLAFVGEVVDAAVLSDAEPLTYAYYHAVLKGRTPPKASSYLGENPTEGETAMPEEKKTYKFICTVCGYEVEVDTPELPEDFVCPVCGVGPDMFEPVEE